ncbi:MAG TPA: DUF2807 domain-containing protein [Cyclobacteriaceae bacterium]|jgi:hypothetical protein|nr:DUF2807 domain-containing protein [Cyclobacteriaceae bacterium]
MKKSLTLLFICSSATLIAQTFEKKLNHFSKVVASPKINLVMMEGPNESVKIVYANVDPSKINMVVRHRTLHIYLDGSKFTEKRKRVNFDGEVRKENVYRDVSITAYVTYNKLQKLVVRGEQEVDIQGPIENKKFKLSAYGECDITLASLQVGWFKAALYGQNVVRIKEGFADEQKYKLFGENRIDAQALQSEEIASTTYGESKLRFQAKQNLRLVTVGESNVYVKGSPEVSKLTLGEISIKR